MSDHVPLAHTSHTLSTRIPTRHARLSRTGKMKTAYDEVKNPRKGPPLKRKVQKTRIHLEVHSLHHVPVDSVCKASGLWKFVEQARHCSRLSICCTKMVADSSRDHRNKDFSSSWKKRHSKAATTKCLLLLKVMQVVCHRGVERNWVGFLNGRIVFLSFPIHGCFSQQ